MYYRIADVTFLSELPLPSYAAFECAPGDADAVLRLSRETPPQGSETRARSVAYRRIEGGWFFHSVYNDASGLIVSGDYTRMRLILPEGKPVTYMEEHYVRVALECLLARRGFVSLHAACFSLDGWAIAFSADSGMGKSTRARAWEEAFGASLISGDRPLIRVGPLEAFGVPWDGKESCYRSVHFPLRMICEVRRAAVPSIRKMTFRQKRQLLLQQCFLPMWDTETAAVQMMNIVRLASSAAIVRAFCGPTAEDARALRRIMDMQQFLEEEPDMKAKSGFVLRNIVDEHVLIPTGDNINQFNGTLLLNDVSAFIWGKLQNPISREDLIAAVLDQYQVDKAQAAEDLDALLEKLRTYGVIEDN